MTKFKHGDRVTCEIMGARINDARIVIDGDGRMHVCQNLVSGINILERFGYKYTWVSNMGSGAFITNLKLKEKTLDDLEVGDILVGVYGNKKVLGICGLVYFLSDSDCHNTSSKNYTIEEIKDMYTLKQEEEPEDEPEELTMAELEKELGRKVKIIK